VQIKLLQGASNAYNLPRDRPFERWFDSVLVLDDKESYELSYQIEPYGASSSSGSGSSRDKIMRKKVALGHKKHDSLASTSSSSSSQFFGDMDSVSSPNESATSFERHASVMSTSSSSSSVPSLDASVTSSATNQSQQSARKTPDSQQKQPDPGSPYITPDFYIIRVTIRTAAHETEGINLYKSIMLSNSERTPQVIRNAMIKHDIEGNSDDYVLAQLLPDGEKPVPPNCNVYYAINTAYDLNFVLRPKKDVAGAAESQRTKESKSKRKLLLLHK